MPLTFSKLHGLGNDFLVALDEQSSAATTLGPDDARRWCERRTGVGADGLIRGEPTRDGGIVMHLWNADGSRAEMSGNGIRCLAHAVLLARGATQATLEVTTDAGLRRVDATLDGPTRASIRVGMGPARPGPEIPPAVRERYPAARMATVDVGNPHLVIEVPAPSEVDVGREGAWAEAQFAAGVNVEFIGRGPEPDALELVVWERGAGITQACGTGAVAAAATAHGWGLVGRLVEVLMPGGAAQVEVADQMVLIGPSELIATVEAPGAPTPGGRR